MSIKRIFEVALTGLFMFIALSVMLKLVLGNENWLVAAGIWAAAWIVGSIVALLFCKISAGTITLFLYNVGVITFVLITLTFILGVVLNLTGWEEIVSNISIPFAMAIFVNSKVKVKAE